MDARSIDFIPSSVLVEILNRRLLEAACQGTWQEISALLVQGAKINSIDYIGDTPLMIAARWGNKTAVMGLMDSGANPSIKNKLGESALTHTIFGQGELIETSPPPITQRSKQRLEDYQHIAFRILSSMTKETIGDIVKQNFVSLNNMVILYHQTKEQFQKDILRKVWDISQRPPYDQRVFTAAFMEIEQPKWCSFSLYQKEILAAIKTCHTLLTSPQNPKPLSPPPKTLTFSEATAFKRAKSLMTQVSPARPISDSDLKPKSKIQKYSR